MADKEFLIDEVEDEPEVEIELLPRDAFFKSVSAENNPIEDIRWVFHALGAKDLKPEDAPSSGAWYLLQTLKADDLALKSFYITVYPKLLPNKAQMEKNDRAEDGRKQFDLIERLLREPDVDAPVLSDVEKQAVEVGTRQLAISKTDSKGRL
ncbi:MAG: hypothetical protein IMZ61_13945 [Planctomycetes bacterium]|nr:hypothetical protein [Chloroflexota bacterium]MBE3145000.1 hypothetical protein [Planctomycetota bacterium]